MSSGSKAATQTTTSEPPAYIRPFLQEGAEASQNLYRQGGTPVTPFSPQTQQALDMTQARATAGSPINRAAQDYFTKTMSGGFMGQNPYLDKTFNQAALATQNQLASEFAGSGRSLDASQHLRSEQLNSLANSIYGGDYEAERQRMQSLVPFAGQLASQDYADIGQLANVGAQYEDLAREQAGQPGTALDQYLARLSGYPGGTVTNITPMERNRLAGALGGAMMGNQMYGGWGALGGGILGGMLG